MVSLGDCDVRWRHPITKSDRIPGPYPYFGATGALDNVDGYIFDEPLVLVGEDGAKWGPGEKSAYAIAGKTWVNNHAHVLRPNRSQLLDGYLIAVLHRADLTRFITGVTVPKLNQQKLREIEIPLPPLEVQRELVAEIESYQRVMDGARAVVDNWRPRIAVDPEWPMVHLGDVCKLKRGPFGGSLKKDIFTQAGYAVYEQRHAISGNFDVFRYFVDGCKYKEMEGFAVFPEDIIMSCSGTMGRTAIIPDDARPGIINQALLKLTTTDKVLNTFVKIWMDSANFQKFIEDIAFGAAIKNVASVNVIKGLQIPLPTLETQRAIVAEIEAEQAIVSANHELAERMEQRIQDAIARVWEG